MERAKFWGSDDAVFGDGGNKTKCRWTASAKTQRFMKEVGPNDPQLVNSTISAVYNTSDPHFECVAILGAHTRTPLPSPPPSLPHPPALHVCRARLGHKLSTLHASGPAIVAREGSLVHASVLHCVQHCVCMPRMHHTPPVLSCGAASMQVRLRF